MMNLWRILLKNIILADGADAIIQISAPEEIGYVNGWITKEKLLESADRYGKSPYGAHLRDITEGKVRY